MQQGVRTNRALARALGVTTDTVRSHLRMIFRHFGVHSRVELMAVLADLELGPALDER